ncbi:hypothetical protein JOE26_003446 [Rhodococcus coprophilus]|uniref:Uncharacterized protein n=1 Tax=Rhodococcus coprophilus TaxID=38310 RepID=A0A2X4U0M2_9NOCA|nr:hypothetical protein [Rhodococcus coprophilus]SQI28578.1 Uncharacterised protein [Rhodococcus coprophilus]
MSCSLPRHTAHPTPPPSFNNPTKVRQSAHCCSAPSRSADRERRGIRARRSAVPADRLGETGAHPLGAPWEAALVLDHACRSPASQPWRRKRSRLFCISDRNGAIVMFCRLARVPCASGTAVDMRLLVCRLRRRNGLPCRSCQSGIRLNRPVTVQRYKSDPNLTSHGPLLRPSPAHCHQNNVPCQSPGLVLARNTASSSYPLRNASRIARDRS